MKRLKTLRVSVFACALLAVGLTACGSSSSSSSTASSSAAPSSTQSSSTTGSPSGTAGLSQATAVYKQFTGGTSGSADASKTPVTIGFMNDQGGVPSFPEGTAAAQAAVQFINKNLGGVGGHPVALKTCFVASAEGQGQTCAQQFLADKVPVIVENEGDVGTQSFHSAIAGKIPVIEPNPTSLVDTTAKNSYAINAGVFGTNPGFVAYATQVVHAKTVSLLFPGDNPIGQSVAKQLEGFLGKAGAKVTPSGFSSNSPDMLPNIVASGAGKTDLTIALTVSPPSCIAAAKALKQANVTTPVVGLFLCISPPVKQGLGDYPKWTYVSAVTNVEFPQDPATVGYIQAMKTYAAPGANIGGNAQTPFVGVLAAVRALNRAGGAAATPTQVASQLKALTGPIPMMDPAVKYGSIPGLPDIPNLGTRLFTYGGSGKWSDATNGKWVAPPTH